MVTLDLTSEYQNIAQMLHAYHKKTHISLYLSMLLCDSPT